MNMYGNHILRLYWQVATQIRSGWVEGTDRSGPEKPEDTNARKPLLLTTRPEDGGSMFFRNVGIHLNYYSVLQPKDAEQFPPRKH
jgi:hypothetical protein